MNRCPFSTREGDEIEHLVWKSLCGMKKATYMRWPQIVHDEHLFAGVIELMAAFLGLNVM
jgi:hypothetical protein